MMTHTSLPSGERPPRTSVAVSRLNDHDARVSLLDELDRLVAAEVLEAIEILVEPIDGRIDLIERPSLRASS